MKLGEVLIRRNLLQPDQLNEAIATQQQTPKKLGELLLERSLITPHDLDAALQEQRWRNKGLWVID